VAEIVLGLGTSHTPMLMTDDEDLTRFPEWDVIVARLDKEGRPATFDQLLAEADPAIKEKVTVLEMEARQNRVRSGIQAIAKRCRGIELDALIIVGDDQDELFKDANRPALAIYWGETIQSAPKEEPRAPAWMEKQIKRLYEQEKPRSFPVANDLALHLITSLVDNDFDVATCASLPGVDSEGHAFAYIHEHLMDKSKPVPIVPVLLNTYYRPNQPRPARCYELGRAIRRAVEAFPGKAKVGILASGGLSHFMVDEDLDHTVIEALRNKDAETLKSLPRNKLQAGSSEILNWVTVAGAVEHLPLSWIEYIPCYRTAAGTGTGVAFAEWKAA
jgi:Catalytic LigB subunit of aromatic ring-opening dioxygenase